MESSTAWERPYFTQPLYNAFLFVCIHGEFNADFDIDRQAYELSEVPDGIAIHRFGPDIHPETVKSYLTGHLWETLQQENSGLAEQLERCPECHVITGEVTDSSSLDYLRNVNGLIAYLLDHGGISVYDPQSMFFTGKEEWLRRFFEPHAPVPLEHVMIIYSEDEGELWYHTRGLRKFGRPDLSLTGVTPECNAAVIELFKRFIKFQALGGIIEDGRAITLNDLPEGMWCENKGDFDDFDFNNKHVEIHWKTIVW